MASNAHDISFVDDEVDVMTLILNSRLELATMLFNEGEYADAVVAYKAAIAMAPDSEEATRGLEQSQRGLAMKDVDLPADASASGEPQVLTHLLRSHLEGSEAAAAAEETPPPKQAAPAAGGDNDKMDVVFEDAGPIGILFEATAEFAAITIGEVKPSSQASLRKELVRGLVLLKVQNDSIEGLKFDMALELLSNQQRPLTLSFSREPLPSPPASPAPSIPSLELKTPTTTPLGTPNPAMRNARETETPFTRVQRDWEDAVKAFNANPSKGVKYMVEIGLVKNTPSDLAKLLKDEEKGLDKQQIGEYLSGGKPDDQVFRMAVRTAYLELVDYTGWSFVAALRSFLRGFRLPGESMLIERIMSSFAVRFYEQNPGYCVHLTDEKIVTLQESFSETSGGLDSVGIHLVNSLFKSLRSDFAYMKDSEVYDMMEVTPDEMAHTRELLETDSLTAEELNRDAATLRRATALMKLETAAQMARSQADSAAVAAEQTAVLAAEAHDDERMQLGRDAGDRGLESEYAETIAAAAEQAAASAADEFEQLTPGFRIELPMFLAMVARKLGTDTMFVLAYSVIMLNTDAHNPQLKGNERISKAQFIENNKRSPDLAAISEVIMASLYDEIVHKEIKLKDEDESDTGDDSAAEDPTGGLSPVGGLMRRMSTVVGYGVEAETPPKAAFDPADVGQKLYVVQQTGLKGMPRKVKVGLTGMGISVFDAKGRPLTNLLYQTMERWGVDRSLSGKVLGLRVLTDEQSGALDITFKTPEGEDLCAVLSAHSLAMKKAERLREKQESEALRQAQRDLETVAQALEEAALVPPPEEPVAAPEELVAPPAVAAAPTTASSQPATVAAVVPAAVIPPRPPALTSRAGLSSEMDATLRTATLSAQRAYVTVAASAAGVDGAEVPRSGREGYIALHRVYNLHQPKTTDAVAKAAAAEPVVQIPLPPLNEPAAAPPAPAAAPAPAPSPADPTALNITTSADLTVDTRFDVIVNSVSPEFQSSGSDSGINFSVWKTLTGYSGSGDKPAPIRYDQTEFASHNGGGPTYGDVLCSDVPSGAAPAGSALKYIVHALAPDLSHRPKRLPSGLSKQEAFAALIAVYFRAIWRATVKGGPQCSIGMPPLGSGVFANDAADVMAAAGLAHAAYRASGGTATVSVALWSPNGAPPKDMSAWEATAAAVPPGAVLLQALTEALAPGGSFLMGKVPKAHTTGELTALLTGSSDPKAAEFLVVRDNKDKAAQKVLKSQLADGTWAPLLGSLAATVDSSAPFTYRGFASLEAAAADNLLRYLCSSEFLHFESPATALGPPVFKPVEKIEFGDQGLDESIEVDENYGEATSESDSEDEDDVEAAVAAAKAYEMGGAAGVLAEAPEGEPQLKGFYNSDSKPMVPMESYYSKSSPIVPASPRANAFLESEFGGEVRRKVQMTRAFTQLREELGDDKLAAEVEAEVYQEVSPPRFADSPQTKQRAAEAAAGASPVVEGEKVRTLTTPDKPPFEEIGKEVLFSTSMER